MNMDMITNSPSYKAHVFGSGDSTSDCRLPYQAWDSTLSPQIGMYSPNVVAFEALSEMGSPNVVTNEPYFVKETRMPVAAAIRSLSCQPYIKKRSRKSWSPPAKHIWKEEVEPMVSGTLVDILKNVKEHAYFGSSPSVTDQRHRNLMGDSIVTTASSAIAVGIENQQVLHCSFSTQSPAYSASMSGSSSDNSALSKVSAPSYIFQPDQFINSLHDKSNMMEYTGAHNLGVWFSESMEDPFSSTTTLDNHKDDEILISSIKIEDLVGDHTIGKDTAGNNTGEAVHSLMFRGHYDDNRQQYNGITAYKGDNVAEHHGIDFERAFCCSLGSIHECKIFQQIGTASGSKRLCPPQLIVGPYYQFQTNNNGLLSAYATAENNEDKPLARYINGRHLDNVYGCPCNMSARSEGNQASENSNNDASAGKIQLVKSNSTLTCEQVGVRFENSFTESGLVHLLTAGAEAVSRKDMDLASMIFVWLKDMVSDHSGSTMQRVATYFIQGLQHQVEAIEHTALAGVMKSQGDILAAFQILHEIFPYIKFGHFTANQAILEAVQGERRVHIVDFEILEGIQWPAFMQALVSQQCASPELHITALCRPHWGHELALVQKTGKRLSEFAYALNLPFRFSLLKTNTEERFDSNSLELLEGEALVVNCMVHLPHMPRRSVPSVRSFLQEMHKLSPKILTVVEEKLGCSTTPVASYFLEAVHHFHAMCDSLEACLLAEVEARMLVERVFVAPRIDAAIALWIGALSLCWQAETEASNNYGWSTLVHATGFRIVPLSSQNHSQARLLLGLYRNGFNLEERSHSLVLGWQSRPLFSASVWK